MVFSSPVFLWIFLPLVLGLYALCPRRGRNLLLLLASLVFYTWGEATLVWIVLASTLLDYVAALVISGSWRGASAPLEAGGRRSLRQRLGLAASLAGNLGFLAYFKYFDFGVESFNALVPEGFALHGLERVVLPIGISFYTFQSMSYTIDVYRGDVRATRRLVDFACYVTLFPQLVAGPIVRYRDIAAQLVSRRVTREGFADGVRRFVTGLGKKVLIANAVAVPADAIFGVRGAGGEVLREPLPLDQLSAPLAWLAVLCYTLQIYFDFSGYSDMAIGLGRMLGFRFLENFRHPYVATSIQDFWRRWHISLSTWFRDYVYIPLGGNRGGPGRTYRNLVLVFLLCGLWHGAAWTFVAWGLFHGVFLALERAGLGRGLERLPRPLRHAYALLVVMVGWVLFRADGFDQARAFLAAMAGRAPSAAAGLAADSLWTPQLALALAAGALGSLPWAPWLERRRDRWRSADPTLARPALDAACALGGALALSAVLLLCAMTLSAGTYDPFIYFRF